MMKPLCLSILIFLSYVQLYAQEHAWVYFADKENVAASIDNPITILTQKTIDRKNKHGVSIDARDVPVRESYITQIKNASGITVLAKSKWFNAVHVTGNQTNIEALERFSFVVNIDFADTNLNQSKTTNNKTIAKLEGSLANFNYGDATNQIEMFNGDELHVLDYTGSGITIAVVDAGFPNVNSMSAFQRLRDAGNIHGTYNFVNRSVDVYTNTTSSHGTLVLSDMAGYVENAFVGTAPDASYYLFITEDTASETPVEESYWVEAVERADSLGVDIINTSLGYSDFDGTKYDYQQSDMDGATAFITKGANIAFEKGLLLVTSAGNSGSFGVTAPADSPNVLSVGAVDASGNYVSFSSVGTSFQPTQKPDVVAQGGLSFVITELDAIGRANGTSFSAPILAGGIACLWQALPDMTNAEIMQLVRTSASQYNTPDNFIGHGIPDLQLALSAAVSNTDIIKDDTTVNVFPNPVSNVLHIHFTSQPEEASITIFDMLGKCISSFAMSQKNKIINMTTFSKGIYIVKIETDTLVKTLKLTKQ